jgi:MAF protein
MTQIVLASSSPYRKALLQRLGLAFETAAPALDESPQSQETPQHLVARLAEAKARALAGRFPAALIIGSDQVAVLAGDILGKPGNHAAAAEQLRRSSGQTVVFHTGLCLYDARRDQAQVAVVPYAVQFRSLSEEEIQAYLHRERPYDCAGSFKSEGLGIALFERLTGDDPNALIGLPLIALCRMLANCGVSTLTGAHGA